jgi:hypothetical protein
MLVDFIETIFTHWVGLVRTIKKENKNLKCNSVNYEVKNINF